MLLRVKEGRKSIRIVFSDLRSIKVTSVLIRLLNSIKNKGKEIILDFTNVKTQSYSSIHTTISGIIEFYESNNYHISVIEKGYILSTSLGKPLYCYTEEDIPNSIFDKVLKFDVNNIELIVDCIINQLKYLFTYEKNFLPALNWCLKEVMDNVINHSGVNSGLIMVQIHKESKYVNVSIYDNGRGLLNSLHESSEYNPIHEFDAIRLAFEKDVTRDKNVGQGFGLWGLRQIIDDNKGYLEIMTGNSVAKLDYKNRKTYAYNNLPILSENNKSTRIDFSLNFDNAINIRKSLDNYVVYEMINMKIDDMVNENDWIIFNVKKEADLGTGTRKAGKKLRKYLLNIYNSDERKIALDFSNVEMISSSFADEFVAKTILEIELNEFNKRFNLINVNENCSIVISSALNKRKIRS